MVERCEAVGFDHARPCKFFGKPDITGTIGSFAPKRGEIDQERDSRRNSEVSMVSVSFPLGMDERSEIHCLRRLDLRQEVVEVFWGKVGTIRPHQCVAFEFELLEIF